MIFVTVGGQLSFDRMVKVIDEWAGATGQTEIFAQIGATSWRPKHIECVSFLAPDVYRKRVEASDLVIAHAGMGSILTCLELGKPLLVMPRRVAFQETRNDHQVATAERFAGRGLLQVAEDESALRLKLQDGLKLAAVDPISTAASPELIRALRGFIRGGNGTPAARAKEGENAL